MSRTRSTHRSATDGGYTAIELLATIAIVAVITAIAVPSFRDFLQSNRAAEGTNALVGALAVARNEAVTRGMRVSVCASDDDATCTGSTDWSTGWIVFTDAVDPEGTVDGSDTVVRAVPELAGGGTLTADADFIAYDANGFLAGPAAVVFDLAVPECRGNSNRQVTVNRQGRSALQHVACE